MIRVRRCVFELFDKVHNLATDIHIVPRQIWTEAEFECFIASVDNLRYRAIFTALFYCGCRVGELQALRASDYDGQQFYIHGTLTRKTMDVSPYRITETKNYKSRYVPLPDKAKIVIDSWIAQKTQSAIPSTYLFGGSAPYL